MRLPIGCQLVTSALGRAITIHNVTDLDRRIQHWSISAIISTVG